MHSSVVAVFTAQKYPAKSRFVTNECIHYCNMFSLSPVAWGSAPVVNGVQPTKHHNGLSSNGEAADFEEIIQLSNHSSSGNSGE